MLLSEVIGSPTPRSKRQSTATNGQHLSKQSDDNAWKPDIKFLASITKIKSATAANQTAKHYLEQQESSVETNECLEQLNAIIEVRWCQRQHPTGVWRISDRLSKPRQLFGHPRPTIQQPIADAINGNHQRKTHKNKQVQEDA